MALVEERCDRGVAERVTVPHAQKRHGALEKQGLLLRQLRV
jgi:hypothetical protein